MNNRITERLHIRYPFIQAPLYFLTNAELVAAVSNAGGWARWGHTPGKTACPARVMSHWIACARRSEK
ncbi:hypothetical protein [Serratia rhizosphaerae]|uniref:hypothetical protein n=1 Tax=Serratia rhizosphaerae TaxID=2597702 RepID=UPI001FE7E2CC|nr:hypothetical protein [Serratia rhizosphaerae]